jgi:FkbM family methyltransferase
MPRTYPAFPSLAKRYFVGGGSYPWTCRVRTPVGTVPLTLYSHHDVWTVHEVFGREDYAAGLTLGAVVDIGSNIGVSALYFLTRNRSSRCWLFEPVPRNAQRLGQNLAGYEDRYVLDEAAVADAAGTFDFAVEATGRYGGLEGQGTDRISVHCRRIDDVLEQVLEREPVIDVLKIDTEGTEAETAAAIPSGQLARIRRIYFEADAPLNPDPERFSMRFACDTCTLENRALAPQDSVRS